MRYLVCLLISSHAAARLQSSRDWAKMSDKDWERIEQEWESPEEKEEYEYKPPKQKGIDMDKLKSTKNPAKIKASSTPRSTPLLSIC